MEKKIHELFELGVFLKGVEGILELFTGFFFLTITTSLVSNVVIWLTRGELTEDPNDAIANALIHWSHQLTLSTTSFIAVFLILHGIINFALVIGIIRKKLWVYAAATAVFLIFASYQIYRFAITHSFVLAGTVVFDVAMALLLIHEYRRIKVGF